MLSRNAYLVVGLLASTALPYASSTPEFRNNVAAWMPVKEGGVDESRSPFQFASQEYSAEQTTTESATPSSTPPASEAAAHTPVAPPPQQQAQQQHQAMPTHGYANQPAHGQPMTAQPVTHARPVSGQQTPARPKKEEPPDTAKLPPSDGSKPIEFGEVFRLDVNAAWLMARWPRVTTGLAEENLHGYRVALVTGIREFDLAGALTYYYDKDQVIQKMTFRGLTGDPRRLVMFCTTTYQFEKVTVQDPSLQVYRSTASGKRESELKIRPSQVIRADAPRERFEVELVLLR